MDELEKLHAQIADLQQKAETLAAQRKASVIDDVKAKIKSYGLTAKDLGLVDRGIPTKPTSTVATKYRHGSNTWTGKGRQPKFIVDYLANGGKLEDLLV